MIVKNIHSDAGWYASYETCEQGEALIRCQMKKIKQLTDLINTISGEIELATPSKEYNEKLVLESISALINQVKEIEYTVGCFKWIG